MAELELVSDCRQMERGREGFYQTHMNVGGDAIYVSQNGSTHTQAEKCKLAQEQCVHFTVVMQTKKYLQSARE